MMINITNVEYMEDGINITVEEPTIMSDISKLYEIHIKDDIMLKILSRYIDNGSNNSDEIEDATY